MVHTEALGALLGKGVEKGNAVLLHGPLGSGKTSFARGFVRSACNDMDVQVTSPTYLLTNEYEGRNADDQSVANFTVYHMDLWRVDDASKRTIVDFADVFQNHVALIEWPDRLKSILPRERLDVYLEYVDVAVTDDNPWGFADDDDTAHSVHLSSDPNSLQPGGRVVTLKPRNEFWRRHIQRISRYIHVIDKENSVLRLPSKNAYE